MRKKELLLFATSLLLLCCNNPHTEIPTPPAESSPIQFNLRLIKEIVPFAETRSYPNGTIPEPNSSNLSPSDSLPGEVQSLCTRIDYVVYSSTDTIIPIKHIKYTIADTDFGIIYDTLPPGNYQFRFLAHSSTTAELNQNMLSFEEVTDTFYKQFSLKIGSGEDVAEDLNLQRIVGRIEFMATDTIHSNLKQFEIRLTGYPNRFNILTGKSIQASDPKIFTHLFSAADAGKKNNSHSLFTFIPEGNSSIGVQLKATNLSDELLRDYTISSVIPIVNQTIRYSGKLYAYRLSNDSFPLYLENINWGETIDIPLGD